jgi:predicted DNA-binding transcriptional regulator YafY
LFPVSFGGWSISAGAAMKRKKRLTRLLEIVLLLQGRPDWRPKALAEHFGVSQTRIYQDIRELVSAGVPVYFCGDGYKLGDGFSLGPTSLTADEILALLYPGYLFSPEDGPTNVQSLLQAKLTSCLPPSLRGRFHASRVKVPSGTARGPRFRRLHEAVTERRRLRITYASRASGKTTEREIDPYALIFRRHSWYLIAKCHRRREVRKFRVDRIRSVASTPARFPEPEQFSLEEYTRGWWEVYGGEPVNVAVRFSRRVADLIRGHAPRPGQTIQELPGGEIIYRVEVRGVLEISWWIMQYGPDAEVLEPKELREMVRDNAKRMVDLYTRGHRAVKRAGRVAEAMGPYYSGRGGE